ncbi:MAG: hypothetical protein JSR37_07300 [Verrucomicrobia bacterium]|nr:hypothetical protein [Verrucomicrobiota bacterium]MBS0637668.1 hypothetical protein [Verrucomicrobiota bacterium]
MSKFAVSAMLAVGMLATTAAWAKNDTHESGRKKFKGVFIQGNGDNFADPSLPNELKCPAFDEHGKRVGYVYSINYGETARHTFIMNDGSCFSQYISNSITLPIVQPIDENVVAALPELAPYLNDESASLLVVISNQSKGEEGVYCWKNRGPKGSIFSGKVQTLDVRCTFLVVDGRIEKCIACSWSFH